MVWYTSYGGAFLLYEYLLAIETRSVDAALQLLDLLFSLLDRPAPLPSVLAGYFAKVGSLSTQTIAYNAADKRVTTFHFRVLGYNIEEVPPT